MIKYCSNCGNKIEVKQKFCGKCGSRLPTSINVNRFKKCKSLLIICSTIIIIVLTIIITFVKTQQPQYKCTANFKDAVDEVKIYTKNDEVTKIKRYFSAESNYQLLLDIYTGAFSILHEDDKLKGVNESIQRKDNYLKIEQEINYEKLDTENISNNNVFILIEDLNVSSYINELLEEYTCEPIQ